MTYLVPNKRINRLINRQFASNPVPRLAIAASSSTISQAHNANAKRTGTNNQKYHDTLRHALHQSFSEQSISEQTNKSTNAQTNKQNWEPTHRMHAVETRKTIFFANRYEWVWLRATTEWAQRQSTQFPKTITLFSLLLFGRTFLPIVAAFSIARGLQQKFVIATVGQINGLELSYGLGKTKQAKEKKKEKKRKEKGKDNWFDLISRTKTKEWQGGQQHQQCLLLHWRW